MKARMGAAALIWALALFASRLIGLVRDAVLGHTLGVTGAADVYRTAFTIPDWFRDLLAGGALSIVFIPIFTAHLERGDEARGWRTFSNLANLLLVLMAVGGTAFWLAADVLARLVAPEFDAAQLELLAHLSRILLPAQVFHILGGLLSASLLARDRHLAPAVAPLVYTLGIIVGGIVTGTAEGFAWGVLAGAFLGPFLVPLLVTARTGLRWSPVLDLRDPDVRTYLSRWVPVMLGGSLVLLDDTLLARFGSGLTEGSIAILGYAKTLMRAPMGIFGAAMGFAAYSTLTRQALEGKKEELYATTTTATRRVLVLAVLSQVGLTVAAPEIATVVYGTSRIPPERMHELGVCLAVFSLGLGPWSAQIMLARAFYAQGRGWVPARIGLASALLCAPLYAWAGDRFGAVGLAACSSLTVTLSVVALQLTLKRSTRGEGGYADLILRMLPLAVAVVALGYGLRELLPAPTWTRLDALVRGGLIGGVCVAVYAVAGLVSGLPELRAALGPILRRLPGRP